MPASASTVNQTLTNYAVGLAQDKASALANFLAPPVPVAVATGQYKAFDEKNAFQLHDARRPVGGQAKRIHFDADDPSFNCQPHALELPIDDHERDLAGEGDPLGLEKAKTATLVSSAVISHEAEVLAKINGSITAASEVGNWSSEDVDPIAELDEMIRSIADDIGMMPNRIAFGLGPWQTLRNHPKVIARQPGASVIGVTASQTSQMLLNPGIDIRVGVLSRDTTKFGKAKSATNMVGANVYVFYASPSPSTYDPSFAKTFQTRRGGVDVVHQYRDDASRSDVIAVDWSADVRVTGKACARRIAIT